MHSLKGSFGLPAVSTTGGYEDSTSLCVFCVGHSSKQNMVLAINSS